MTKLTVAEASRRGYATSLSILQAVQKNWLVAERSTDGQLMVDTNDLEQLFGLPSDAVRAADHVPSPAVAGQGLNDIATHRDADVYRRSDSEPEVAEHASADDELTPDDDEFEPEPDEGWGNTVNPAHTAADVDARDADTAALRAEIARLEAELVAERRRTAALLDVLADRMPPAEQPSDVPPAGASDPGDPVAESPPSAASDDVDADRDIPGEGAIDPFADAPSDLTFSGYIGHDLDKVAIGETTADEFEPDKRGADDHETAGVDAHDGFGDEAEVAVPPMPTNGGDTAAPILAADPQSRAIPRSLPVRPAVPDDRTAQPFIWQLWALVAIVWVGLIGAFFWYFTDLGADLWVIAQWIRGERMADSAEFAAALQAVFRAARDTLGPPAALYVVLLAVNAAFRALRR